jgi:DNA-binding FadR family transcriptional regulator
MTSRTGAGRTRFVLFVAAAAMVASGLRADVDLEQKATWTVLSAAQAKAQLDAFLHTRTVDEPTAAQIAALWPPEPGPAESAERLLDQVAATLALVDENAKRLVDFCSAQTDASALTDFPFLRDAQQPPFLRSHLRLVYGRWLAQHQCYDEALEQLSDLTPADVVDPAALLFYQSVSYHRMPDKRKCVPLVARLLENRSHIPRRYLTVAQLIQADIAPLETDSLDEISRLMDEVRRRLELKRAGTRVRQQEDEVIAKLDKLIKKIEEQQQQQQAAASVGNLQPSNPAQDSLPAGGKGPGNIDPKQIGSKSGWGNLPPAERQEALQQIGKDLPAHYREVIEEYFRKLAREGSGQ